MLVLPPAGDEGTEWEEAVKVFKDKGGILPSTAPILRFDFSQRMALLLWVRFCC